MNKIPTNLFVISFAISFLINIQGSANPNISDCLTLNKVAYDLT